MLALNLNSITLRVFIGLLTLLATACQQPATYAPVKTVNQAVLTDDEISLRQAREQRQRSRRQNSPYNPQASTIEPSPVPQNAQETAKIAANQLPPPVSPDLLPPVRQVKQRTVSKSSRHNHVNIPVKPEKRANLAVPVKPTPRQQNQKVDMESARKLDDDRKIKPEAKSSPKKQAKTGKNVEEKISSISNINKKVLKLNFEWPVRGKVIKNFAQSDNKGIDIAGEFGQSVRAAEAGKAVYCGDGLAGYGNLVIVKHDDSYLSAYAHNSRLNVKEGQPIKKGQVIARIGRPGSRQPLLHFQIRKNGKSINPLTLLPKH